MGVCLCVFENWLSSSWYLTQQAPLLACEAPFYGSELCCQLSKDVNLKKKIVPYICYKQRMHVRGCVSEKVLYSYLMENSAYLSLPLFFNKTVVHVLKSIIPRSSCQPWTVICCRISTVLKTIIQLSNFNVYG